MDVKQGFSGASCEKEDSDQLNLAALCRHTATLGPGRRYAIWVQGCPFHCPGCIAPAWRELRIHQLVSVSRLVADILAVPELEGITISGGEPMLQAPAVWHLATALRQHRPSLTLMLYTGFQLQELRTPTQLRLLEVLDVLIDGRYQAERNDNRGLRGSSNQRVHLLSSAYRDLGTEFFTHSPRHVELLPHAEELLMIGIPPLHLDAKLRQL